MESREMPDKPSAEQLRVADALELDVSNDSEIVAAARIHDAVADAIGDRHGSRQATPRQIDFGRSLGMDLANDSLRVASARIAEVLYRRNAEAIDRMGLKPGDRVAKRHLGEHNGE